MAEANYFAQFHTPADPQDENFFNQFHEPETKRKSFLDENKSVSQKLWETPIGRAVSDIYEGGKFLTMGPGQALQSTPENPVTTEEMIPGAAKAAALVPAGGTPAVAAVTPSVKSLIEIGGKQVGAARTSGVPIPAAGVRDAVNSMRLALPKGIDADVAPKTFKEINKLVEKADADIPVDFQEMHNARLRLEAVQRSSLGPDAKTELNAATKAKHAFDDWAINSPHVPPEVSGNLVTGNANVAAGEAAAALDRRAYRAELRSSAANSGMNEGNTIRSQVASMLLSPESRSWTPAIRKTAEDVVHGSATENTMRWWDRYLGGGGGLGAQAANIGGGIVGGGLGLMFGGPAEAGVGAGVGYLVAPTLGALLRTGSNKIALSHLDKLSELLRSAAPESQKLNVGNINTLSPSADAAQQALIRTLLVAGGHKPRE